MNTTQVPVTVGFVMPAIAGHATRGTGTYAKELAAALSRLPGMVVREIVSAQEAAACDLIHYPSFDPFFLTLPLLKKKPTIVTVHDLIPLRYPQHFPSGLRGQIKWQIQRLALSRADAVVTDSQASKSDIVRFTGRRPDTIQVVYLGVSSTFKPIAYDDGVRETLQKYNLPKRFILHVGDVNYNKNMLRLFQALSTLAADRADAHLVCVGKGFITPSKELTALKHYITEHALEDHVSCLGYISLIELVHLYTGATCYVQPSLAEGFGLPVLEAMACGCPTVVSDTTSLSEIAQGAARMIDPQSAGAIAEGISEILDDQAKQQDLRKKGFQQAARFTWEKTAQETAAVYQRVLRGDL